MKHSISEQFHLSQGRAVRKNKIPVQFEFSAGSPRTLTTNWNLITRPVFPFIFGQPVFNTESGFNGKSGLGDIAMVNLLSTNKPSGFIWGAGPTRIFPTATNRSLGQEEWQAGPAAVGLYLSKDWIFGAFPPAMEVVCRHR
jgi:hypothetical protein